MSFQSVLSPQIIFFNAENAIFTFRFATLIAISFAAEAVATTSLLLKYVCFKNRNILMHDLALKVVGFTPTTVATTVYGKLHLYYSVNELKWAVWV